MSPVHWSEQSWDEMFNGWMELSVDKHVIAYDAVYTIATPVNRRVSLGVSGGPPGTVYVRDADGGVVAAGAIGPAPSFIEPWTFAPGQTIATARTGPASGTVTLTLYDVPPDVERIDRDRRPRGRRDDDAAGTERHADVHGESSRGR